MTGPQRRKILLMGPSVAGLTGPQRRSGAQRFLNSGGRREGDCSVRGGLLAAAGMVLMALGVRGV